MSFLVILLLLIVEAAMTKYCRLRGFINRHLFLTVLEPGSPRSSGFILRLLLLVWRRLPFHHELI